MSRGCAPVVHFDTATSEVARGLGHHIDMSNAEEIATLLQKNPVKDSEISANLIRYAANHYNWTKICEELISIYEKAIKVSR